MTVRHRNVNCESSNISPHNPQVLGQSKCTSVLAQLFLRKGHRYLFSSLQTIFFFESIFGLLPGTIPFSER